MLFMTQRTFERKVMRRPRDAPDENALRLLRLQEYMRRLLDRIESELIGLNTPAP
jgi:hypothetical protein